MFPTIHDDQFVEVWPGNGEPQITVLMPIYQQVQYVREAINSILDQRGAVAEIIISDDASTDKNFEAACEVVKRRIEAPPFEHRIVVRRGTTRLRRDHLPLLIDNAKCDLVCQAHGDDFSHPYRIKFLIHVLQNPDVSLVTSEAFTVGPAAKIRDHIRKLPPEFRAYQYSYDDVLIGKRELIGFAQAWRRSAVKYFHRLDLNLAACAHDRILPFRAALVGKVMCIATQLVVRRIHTMAWHRQTFHEPQTNEAFGWNLERIAALATMRNDLATARDNDLIGEELFSELKNKIDALSRQATSILLEAHRVQTREGRHIAWVDDATLLWLRETR